jgi:hypothetical protein
VLCLLGAALGSAVGTALGSRLETELGSRLGMELGAPLGNKLGSKLGKLLGKLLGNFFGNSLGSELGAALGNELGSVLGIKLGTELGTALGSELGPPLGRLLGSGLGIELCIGLVFLLGAELGGSGIVTDIVLHLVLQKDGQNNFVFVPVTGSFFLHRLCGFAETQVVQSFSSSLLKRKSSLSLHSPSYVGDKDGDTDLHVLLQIRGQKNLTFFPVTGSFFLHCLFGFAETHVAQSFSSSLLKRKLSLSSHFLRSLRTEVTGGVEGVLVGDIVGDIVGDALLPFPDNLVDLVDTFEPFPDDDLFDLV